MKVNLENMHSPCERCYIRGQLYSPDNDVCQRCEYAIAMNILRSVCKILSGSCGYCRHYPEGCAATTDECEWHIDWNMAVKHFNEV